jgi:putative DNA primase/helicase
MSVELDNILSRLHGVTRNGDGFTALCPAHEDRRASLSVRDGEKGVLVKCHAGCATEAVVAQIGLAMHELFFDSPTNSNGHGNHARQARIVATYPYVDESGALLFEVLRYDPKNFKQRKPNGNGGWIPKLGNVRRVPYRLPEVLAANDVVVPEGERDCNNARTLGFVATCNPGGAGKWREEFSEVLRGKNIVIIQDADEPGRKHAQRVARSIWLRAASIKVLELPGAKDLTAWIERGGTREMLLKIIWNAPEWKPSDAAEPVNSEAVGVFGILASEVKQRRVEWLWFGRIPLGKVTVLDGDPGLGKSAVTLDIAARVTRGAAMPDGTRGVSGGVLVLNAEDDEGDTIVPRLAAMNADLTRVRILKTIPGADGERQPEIPGDLEVIERTARSVDAKFVIVDPIMAFLSGARNSWKDQDVRRALAPLAALAERLGAAIVIVRHLNKDSAEANPLYRGGGSIGIVGAARSGLLIASDPDDETGESRVIASTKSNLGRLPPSLCYVIEPRGESIAIRWCGESQHRAASLLAVPANKEERTEVEEAVEYLRSTLAHGPLAAKEIFRKANADGFSEKTIKRAKARAGIKHYREGFGAKGRSMWLIPTEDKAPNGSNTPSKEANDQSRAQYEQASDSKPVESVSSPNWANSESVALNGEGMAHCEANETREQSVPGGCPERFGQPQARLFPFIGKRVRTPLGTGRLETAYMTRCEVVLDSAPGRLTVFQPDEICIGDSEKETEMVATLEASEQE